MRSLMAGGVLLTIAAAAAAAQPVREPAQPLTVELSSFKFRPATLSLIHGRAYRLRLVNTSSGGHDFDAPQFFASSTVAPEDAAKVRGGRVELAGGEPTDIVVIPNQPGTYKLRCTHFMHGMLGMTGRIVVQ
ncbi:MAG: cupredoxin domain-containing protein [Novosphingobium sp.]|nr:cupredoxin domain-containing protein [Novosphingobium sp.]